jgi:hypothetical protein
MTEPLRSVIQLTHDSLKDRIYSQPAAVDKHHWWPAGWSDHTAQVMDISNKLWKDILEKTPFISQDDVLLVAFVHDLDKLWRYRPTTNKKLLDKGRTFEYNDDLVPYTDTSKTVAECYKRGIHLEDRHLEAIDHHHGGWSFDISSVYAPYGRNMTSLSTILHCADMMSSKIYGEIEPLVLGKSDILAETATSSVPI